MRCRNCAVRDEDGKITEMGHHETVEEARDCNGTPNPRAVTKSQTFVRNSIREGGLLAEHFTKDGLKHLADLFDLDTTGTKDALRERIKEVL